MFAAPFHKFCGTIELQGCCYDSGLGTKYGNTSVRFVSIGSAVDNILLTKGKNSSGDWKLHFACSSPSHASVAHPVSSTPRYTTGHDHNTSKESALILIRHGESFWNEKNLFTGCVDVPLTKRGVQEAIEAGRRISNIPIDVIYTSALIRSQMTAMLAMTQLRHKKVPIFVKNGSEQAKAWGRIFSEDTRKQSIPVITAWQLNERMYGNLQGHDKKVTAEKYGKEKVYEWRRSYHVSPPNGESLEICSQRAVAYFKENIETQLQSGKHVMVAAHANSLRAIIKYIEKLTCEEVINLELSNGIPLLYILNNEGQFMKRGSPVGPTEAGVYAYTKSLALYRQSLDEMVR